MRARAAEDALQQQSRARSAEVYELKEKLRWHAENSELVDSNHARLHQQVFIVENIQVGELGRFPKTCLQAEEIRGLKMQLHNCRQLQAKPHRATQRSVGYAIICLLSRLIRVHRRALVCRRIRDLEHHVQELEYELQSRNPSKTPLSEISLDFEPGA